MLAGSMFFLTGCRKEIIHGVERESVPLPGLDSRPVIAPALLKLQKAYPGHFRISYPDHIVWNDGTVMTFNINIAGSEFSEHRHYPDLAAQMATPYLKGRDYPVPVPKNYDPGRTRYEPFFLKMYGESAEDVRKKLAPVRWLPRSSNRILYATTVNGVNEKLQAVSNELDLLPDNIKRYAVQSAGTFYWRHILDSHRLSPHSFGIAIDLDASLSHYWKWDYPGARGQQDINNKYTSDIPVEIIEIFEKYGFIWGGKWYHYDTMHFEYRPELLVTLSDADSF